MRFAVHVEVARPRGHRRSRGPDDRAGAARARLRGRRERCASARSSASTSRRPTRRRRTATARGDVRPAAREPGHRAQPTVSSRRDRAGRPDDERTASPSSASRARTASTTSRAALESLGGAAELVWHAERSLGGARRRRAPGRLRPRRLPPSRRDRPVLAGDGGGRAPSPRTGGPVLGICNGFQVLTEAGLLPGALMRNDGPAVPLYDRRLRGASRRPRCSPAGVDARRRSCRCRSTTTRATTPATPRTLDELEGDGQIVLRYLENPNGSIGIDRRRRERGRQRRRAHAAPRAGDRTSCSAPPTASCCSRRCFVGDSRPRLPALDRRTLRRLRRQARNGDSDGYRPAAARRRAPRPRARSSSRCPCGSPYSAPTSMKASSSSERSTVGSAPPSARRLDEVLALLDEVELASTGRPRASLASMSASLPSGSRRSARRPRRGLFSLERLEVAPDGECPEARPAASASLCVIGHGGLCGSLLRCHCPIMTHISLKCQMRAPAALQELSPTSNRGVIAMKLAGTCHGSPDDRPA